jgi:RNA-directed DNA polymerase
VGRSGNADGGKPGMNERGKSDSPVVPAKPPNKAVYAAAEVVEERGLAEGNTTSTTHPGRRAGTGVPSGLARVREVARKDKEARFTALLHHVDLDRLRAAYWAIRPTAAPGVDGVTWEAYGQELEGNLRDLHARLHAGRYRAKPSRRAYIPKADGRSRPLGIAVGIDRKSVNWVLDADIREFFTSLDHRWLMKFLEHRIADQRVLRLIRKWLSAGVIENGRLSQTVEGAPQGASVSPLLANVYLHYVFDLWVQWWRSRHARGDVIIVRFADDFTAGFEYPEDAQRFLVDLRERFAKFGLELHPDKTRLIEFGRHTAWRRAARGVGKPETFDFLGFTHLCATTKGGRFWVRRITIKKRMRAKLREVKEELKRRRHEPIPMQGQWLRSVVQGHLAYFAVPGNTDAVATFRTQIGRHWYKALRRRSQRTRLNWTRMDPITKRWLPPARPRHPFPSVRFDARTRGRSPVR